MSLVRDIGQTVVAMQDRIFVTSASPLSTAGSTAGTLVLGATAEAAISGTAANGRIIDRLSAPLGPRYYVAAPSATLYSSRGSTEADRKITLSLKLQHGDSSGGGDMADYSTGMQPDDREYFSTARTSDMANWDGSLSTGPLYAASSPAYYDLRAAKRYIRTVVTATKNRVTTESSGDEQSRLSAQVTFMAADQLPQVDSSTSPYSDSTST